MILSRLGNGMPQHGRPPELQYYNASHMAFMILPIVIIIAICLVMTACSAKMKKRILLIISFVNVAVYVSYKIVMALTFDTFDIWGELPLQLCNINIFLIPIALLTNNRTLYSYLYFVGAIGAICAFPFFDVYFVGRPTFSYPVMAFFLFHSLLVAIPIAIVCTGIYTPKISDVIRALAMLVILALVMHCVNLLFINTGLCPEANYFYTMGMPGNPLMDKLWQLTPIPFLFFLPILIPLVPINILMALPFYLRQRALAENQTNTQ